MNRLHKYVVHECTLRLKRILQSDKYTRKITLYWAINAQRTIDTYLEHFYHKPV